MSANSTVDAINTFEMNSSRRRRPIPRTVLYLPANVTCYTLPIWPICIWSMHLFHFIYFIISPFSRGQAMIWHERPQMHASQILTMLNWRYQRNTNAICYEVFLLFFSMEFLGEFILHAKHSICTWANWNPFASLVAFISKGNF